MKDRIAIEEGGISVEKKKGTDYKLFYFKFHFSDEDYEENSMLLQEINYSEIFGNQSIVKMNEGDCVCLIEKEGDKEVERYEYFYRKERAQGHLECRIKKARLWGKNTWRIAFFCDCVRGEPIGSRHFKVCYGERRFAFPKDSILVKGKKGRNKSEYFIMLPDKADIRDIFVDADDVVRGKYTYECKGK